MASSYNPYEAPGAGGYGMPQQAASMPQMGQMESMTPRMVDHLRDARPWIRLLSVFCFLGAGFMVLGAGLMFLGGLVGLAASGKSGMGGAEALVGPIGGLLYLLVAGFYAIPGILMHRFANAIDSFVMAQSASTMEDALDKSRSYWKTCGIMALVMVGFTILLFVGTIVLGVVAGLAAKP